MFSIVLVLAALSIIGLALIGVFKLMTWVRRNKALARRRTNG